MRVKAQTDAPPAWSIVIHGGAGVAEHDDMPSAVADAYRAGLTAALRAGSAVLDSGGSALDGVEAAIRVLEDDRQFNAGRGAVFTAQGANALDAAIMDGPSLQAGAVAAVTRTRHPIALARAVMERSPHVMLTGDGADAFSAAQGLAQVDPAYFFDEARWRALLIELDRLGLPAPARPFGVPGPGPSLSAAEPEGRHFGTVGAVARDRTGRIAAGTSTGGMSAKQWGRVGDSPIIGAGTYANAGCGVSATGSGEYFIRLTAAREVCALVEYRGLSLQAAADEVIQKRLTALGGEGGLIALSADGAIAWSFNTSALFRAKAAANQAPVVAMFADEP